MSVHPTYNGKNIHRDIIVIGASAGGVEAMIELIAELPADLNATVFVVHHMPAYAKSNLSDILNRNSRVPAEEAVDGRLFEKRKIYCPVPDHHLLLEGDRVVLSKGPKENRFRPAIDALFRSASYEYRERVIGVVLSGALNDGTAGMCTIKRFGGLSLVQCPSEALFDSMPLEVGRYTQIDHSLPAAELGVLIGELTRVPIATERQIPPSKMELVKMEVEISKNKNPLDLGVFDNHHFTPFTCPDCHGALVQITEDGIIRFRCHTGHSFTSDALLSGITENIEKDLWKVMRGMEEGSMILNHLAKEFDKMGHPESAERFQQKADHLVGRSKQIHQVIGNTDPMSVEKLAIDN